MSDWDPNAVWIGFELITGGQTFRWSSAVNPQGSDVVWQGNAYPRWPVEAEGFEVSGDGPVARPTLRAASPGFTIGDIARANGGLIGCKVIRHVVRARYLDAVNFQGGNPTADPLAESLPEVWFINRRTREDRYSIEFELRAATDLQDAAVPSRVMGTDSCEWTDPADCPHVATCSHTMAGCRAKWGAGAVLPFGGWPALGLRRIR